MSNRGPNGAPTGPPSGIALSLTLGLIALYLAREPGGFPASSAFFSVSILSFLIFSGIIAHIEHKYQSRRDDLW